MEEALDPTALPASTGTYLFIPTRGMESAGDQLSLYSAQYIVLRGRQVSL